MCGDLLGSFPDNHVAVAVSVFERVVAENSSEPAEQAIRATIRIRRDAARPARIRWSPDVPAGR
jgi:hypothetical protein